MKKTANNRRICFVTGSRAESGLMESTLRAIQNHPKLRLQIIATGMHLNPAHGPPLAALRGFKPDKVVGWDPAFTPLPSLVAHCTGLAILRLAAAFRKLKPDVILVVGDRVEAFAAAATAHISQIPLAHIHGGDRALGQIDDSLRHAITKLAHLHFPATARSAQRIAKMGEDLWRIHHVGSPGGDGITKNLPPWSALKKELPGLTPNQYALVLLHPTNSDNEINRATAGDVFLALDKAGIRGFVLIYPNNDPGSTGIIDVWNGTRYLPEINSSVGIYRDMARPLFLSFLKHAALLIGNSSSGIIEAASFGTPVINIGDRQKGRERNKNVIDVPANAAAIRRALKKVWNNGHPSRFPKKNLYGSGRTSEKIAHLLATIPLDERLRRKLIAY